METSSEKTDSLDRFLSAGFPERSTGEDSIHAGRLIGDFRLVQRLGSGGMGEVWRAEQISLGGRAVAVKFVRPDRVTQKHLQLFAREARAGGRLAHPGIVTVLAHGESDGLAWIAMELVPGGRTLRDLIERARSLSEVPAAYDREVAALIAEIATAMQIAHDAGVVHRDLKPRNILVTAEGGPKVTDFGMAQISDESALTTPGEIAGGTTLYMSPEQLSGDRSQIDARSDVFALGVVLYELLALQRPFQGDSHAQIAAQILHKDPPDLRTIRSRVPRDLAVIARKALEKERGKRFQTMAELAADLRRFLANEPILARLPTRVERICKWMKRNPGKSSAAAIVVVTFTAIALLLVANVRANRDLEAANVSLEAKSTESEQRRVSAEEAARRATKIADLVQTSLIGGDPNQGGNRNFLVSEAMDRVIGELERESLRHDPATEASLQNTIATILNGNGRSAEALQLATQSLATRMKLTDEGDDYEVATSLMTVGSCLVALGQSDEALAKYDSALEMSRRLFVGDHQVVAYAMGHVGVCLDSLSRSAEALPHLEAALAMRERIHRGDHVEVAEALNNVAACLASLARYEEALTRYEAALEMSERLFAGDAPAVASGYNNIGALLSALDQTEEALAYYRTALEMCERMFPGDHPMTASSINNVGVSLETLGRHEESLLTYETALAMQRRLYQGDHPSVAQSLHNVGSANSLLGRKAQALEKYQEALSMRERIFQGDHPEIAISLCCVASLTLSINGSRDALPYAERAAAMTEQFFPESSHWRIGAASILKRVRDDLPEAPTNRTEATGEN